MHTVQLKLDDNIYSNVMFLLNNLNIKGMEISEKVNNKIDLSRSSAIADEISEIKNFSNHSANLVEEWKDLSEDEIWS
jgi:hypothetical protein